ncbi:MAG: hypothetical protein QM729_16825 [Solirubrobacterales bacterium]
MAATNIKDLLQDLSVAKLQKMDEAIDQQITELKTEKRWIADALTKKGAAPKSSKTETAPKKPRRPSTGGQKNGSAAILKEIVANEPERVWTPAEVIDAAHAQGVRSTANSIRVALRRMGANGFLERGPEGEGWTLARSNGSPQGSFDGEQTSETSHLKAVPAGGRENVG